MNNQPNVSIVIPTFNRAGLTIRAIKSVQQQSYTSWELIIVDDNSTDDSKILIQKYIDNDCRIRLISNYNKKGPAGSRNTGIENSRGNYLSFLDSDDEWLKNHLSESIQFIEANYVHLSYSYWINDIDGLRTSCDTDIFNSKLESAIMILKPRVYADCIIFNKGYFEHFVDNGLYCFHINTLVIDRYALNVVGKFDDELLGNEDMNFAFRIFDNFDFVLIRHHHFIYYTVSGSDAIFSFINRSDIDLSLIKKNKDTLKRLLHHSNDKVLLWEKAQKMFSESEYHYSNVEHVKKRLKYRLRQKCYTSCILASLLGNWGFMIYLIKYVVASRNIRNTILLLLFFMFKGRTRMLKQIDPLELNFR